MCRASAVDRSKRTSGPPIETRGPDSGIRCDYYRGGLLEGSMVRNRRISHAMVHTRIQHSAQPSDSFFQTSDCEEWCQLAEAGESFE